jgi:hypothetical protein
MDGPSKADPNAMVSEAVIDDHDRWEQLMGFAVMIDLSFNMLTNASRVGANDVYT